MFYVGFYEQKRRLLRSCAESAPQKAEKICEMCKFMLKYGWSDIVNITQKWVVGRFDIVYI